MAGRVYAVACVCLHACDREDNRMVKSTCWSHRICWCPQRSVYTECPRWPALPKRMQEAVPTITRTHKPTRTNTSSQAHISADIDTERPQAPVRNVWGGRVLNFTHGVHIQYLAKSIPIPWTFSHFLTLRLQTLMQFNRILSDKPSRRGLSCFY